MDYLGGLMGPLGVAAQFLRGMGMSLRVVSGIMFAVCVGLVIVARMEGPPDVPILKTMMDGAVWLAAAFGVMFGTAAGAYNYAAGGKNPEERAARAGLPMVPVTDPDKVITVKP